MAINHSKSARQCGSALISALFIMTLIAIAATAMSTRLQLDIYRTHLILSTDQRYLASQAVTFWAMDVLKNTHQPSHTLDPYGKILNFPTHLSHIYPNIELSGSLYDLQARFNLNNLQDEKYKVFFYGLLENTLTKTTATQRRIILNSMINWLSPYRPDRGHDQLLSFYLQHKPPYVPSYQPMNNVSEFRLVYGVDKAIYQILSPHVIVLPGITPINLNTASKIILKSLGNGLNNAQVNELLKARGNKGFTNLNTANQLLNKLNIPNDQITLESGYFLCVTTIAHLTTFTLIKRSLDKTGLKITTSILNESFNTP